MVVVRQQKLYVSLVLVSSHHYSFTVHVVCLSHDIGVLYITCMYVMFEDTSSHVMSEDTSSHVMFEDTSSHVMSDDT